MAVAVAADGPYLESLDDESAVSRRRDLTAVAREARLEYARALRVSGSLAEALGAVQLVVQDDPYRDPDHRAAASISFNAWLQCGMKFEYFFCETASGGEMQTQQFIPNRYLDVESVMELKRSSHEANRFIKQGVPDAELWARFRGMQYGCRFAEAFVQVQTVATMPPENLAPRRWYYGGLRMHADY